MSETIVLPRSEVKARIDRDPDSDWVVVLPSRFWFLSFSSTRERAIELADAEALALRAALMPADARERVARVMFAEVSAMIDPSRGKLVFEDYPGAREAWTRVADAVLAALNGGSDV